MKRYGFLIGVVLALALVGTAACGARQSSPPPPTSEKVDPKADRILDLFIKMPEDIERELDIQLFAMTMPARKPAEKKDIRVSYRVGSPQDENAPVINFVIRYNNVPADFWSKTAGSGEAVEIAGLEGRVMTSSPQNATGLIHRSVKGKEHVFTCEVKGWPADDNLAKDVVVHLLSLAATRLNAV